MILLIRMKAAAIRAVKTTLNSIMFLLIPERIYHVNAVFLTLNSIMFLLIPSKSLAPHAIFPAFKFHYVSINSTCLTRTRTEKNPLNSIMFLLILDYRIVENIIMTPLNSIMFLLIL